MWEALRDSAAGWAEQAVPPQPATSPTLPGSCESANSDSAGLGGAWARPLH